MKRIQVLAVLALAAVAGIAYAVDPAAAATILPGIFGPDAIASLGVALPALAGIGATNYVQEGETLTLTAPYTVTSGSGALVGSIFGVALTDITSGADGEFATKGVFDLLCVTGDAFALGAKVYWDDGAKKCDSSSSTTSLIGVAVQAKSAGTTTVRVRLDGVAI